MPDVEVVQDGWFLLPHVFSNGTVPFCGQGLHSDVLFLEVQGPDQAFFFHLSTVADCLALCIQCKVEQHISNISTSNDYLKCTDVLRYEGNKLCRSTATASASKVHHHEWRPQLVFVSLCLCCRWHDFDALVVMTQRLGLFTLTIKMTVPMSSNLQPYQFSPISF